MVKFNFKKLISLIIIAFFLWSVGAMYITYHETIHQNIFTHYNIKSEISIHYLKLSGTTTPTSYDNCNDFCLSMHTWNDLIGYYLSIIIYFIIILILIIFLLKKNEEGK